MSVIKETYQVGEVTVNQRKLSDTCFVWASESEAIRDGLSVHVAGENWRIEHSFWRTGWAIDYRTLAEVHTSVPEAKRQLEYLLPHLMRYVAYVRAAEHEEMQKEGDPVQFTNQLDGLLKTVLDGVAKIPGIELYEEQLELISSKQFVVPSTVPTSFY